MKKLVTLLGVVCACSPRAALDESTTPASSFNSGVSIEPSACACEESPSAESKVPASSTLGDEESNRSCQESAESFVAFPHNNDVKVLNARLLELKPGWANSPVSLALRAVGLTKTGVRSVNVEYLNDAGEPTREGASEAKILVVLDEMDDSVSQTRWQFLLRRSAIGAWSYKSVRQEWLCHRGRGQSNFAEKLCL